MAAENKNESDSVGLFLRSMVDREPGKRKVKPSKAALVDLATLDLGESSDDSDFNVDEAKLNEDDDISINSDPDDDDDDEEEDGDTEEDESNCLEEKEENLSLKELLEIAKQKQNLYAQQGLERPTISVCAVCLGDNSDDTNEIVSCDGCRVSVHEGCYGISDSVSVSSTVSSASTEPWFCDACKAGVLNPPCELCPNLGHTILKETEMGRWVHLVCALYVPGVAFSEVDRLSLPTLFEIPYNRWGAKTCILCEDERYSKTGICIGCDAGMCRANFHVTCAQREGLLSEVNHGEADQADPYYAHCKLHTEKELVKKRKRNWLALQLHMKREEIAKSAADQAAQDRTERKLKKYREKYLFYKSTRPAPWYPTKKLPRPLSTCASLFRDLLHKTDLMGINTDTSFVDNTSVIVDIRKRWHIPPAFSVEFISYYLDRMNRLQEMKSQLDALLRESEILTQEEAQVRERFSSLEKELKMIKNENNYLLNKALEIHDILKGLAGRPLRLPAVIANLHNPPLSSDTQSPSRGEHRVITKAAAKMITDNLTFGKVVSHHQSSKSNSCGTQLSGEKMSLNNCSVCSKTTDQHLLIECDTCSNFYHLGCLDPPLSRMPKKTKQMGWQCSDCCKSSDSEKISDIDVGAPRRLRRLVKEPTKFSPSVGLESEANVPEKISAALSSNKGSEQKNLSSEVENAKKELFSHVKSLKRKKKSGKKVSGKKKKLSKTCSKSDKSPGKLSLKKQQEAKNVSKCQFRKVCTDEEIFAVESMSVSSAKMSIELSESKILEDKLLDQELKKLSDDFKKTEDKTNNLSEEICSDSTEKLKTLSVDTSNKALNNESNLSTENILLQENSVSQKDQESGEGLHNLEKLISLSTDSANQYQNSKSKCVSEKLKDPNNSGLEEAVSAQNGLSTSSGGGGGLDESLPSPFSETLLSADDESLSPRKKHRDGSKKKKREKEKDGDGLRKKKKHHHKEKLNQVTQVLAPFRIKIKPLPPRPSDSDADHVTSPNQDNVSYPYYHPGTTTTTLPPPGYPPLPPGYTLTQPMSVDTPIIPVSFSVPTNYSSTPQGTSVAKSPVCNNRKKDPQDQFSKCDVCGETGGVTNTVLCDECQKAYHFNCLEPPLKKSPKRRGYSWFCEDCDAAATELKL